MEVLVKQQAEANASQQALHWELMAGRVGVAAGAAASCPAPSVFLLRQTEIDDREVNLQTFWRTVVQKKWSLQHWASLLAPFLSGAVLNQDWN